MYRDGEPRELSRFYVVLRALGTAIVAGLGRPFAHAGLLLKVGASVGIARAEADTTPGLFARADAALYAAKESGRNTAVLDHDGAERPRAPRKPA